MSALPSLSNPQAIFLRGLNTKFRAYVGGFGCVAVGTLIQTIEGLRPIESLDRPTLVLSWNDRASRFEYSLTGGAFPKGAASLYRITTTQGEFVASGHHRVFCADYTYRRVDALCVGDGLNSLPQGHLPTILASAPISSHASDPHCLRTHVNSMGRYAVVARRYGLQLLQAEGISPVSAPSRGDALEYVQTACPAASSRMGALQRQAQERIRQVQLSDRPSKPDCWAQSRHLGDGVVDHALPSAFERTSQNTRLSRRSRETSGRHHKATGSGPSQIYGNQVQAYQHSTTKAAIIAIEVLEGKFPYYDMQVLETNNYVCGNGLIHHNSGKTFVGCVDQLLFAGAHPKTVQGYFAPTYRDIRDTFWPTMEEAADLYGFRTQINKSDKEIHFYRGKRYYGTTICRSMDDPGNIVGFKIARGLIDEIDILSIDKATAAWRKIIARMRLVIPGVVNGIGVTTTPEGFKFVYQAFKAAAHKDYSMVQASTYENEAYLPPDYIQSLRDSYPQELIDAYLLGEFVNLTAGTVYRNYRRQEVRSRETIRENEPLHIGQDFNVNNMASVVFVERENGWHAVAELGGILDTPALIETLKEKWPDRSITIYPDASGGSRKTVNASISDLALLRSAGFSVRAKDANPPVKDRILAVNTGYSKSQLWVNDKACPRFAHSQEQQAYDKNGEPDKSAGHDHHNDAAGYFVHWTMPVRRPIAQMPIKFAY